MSRRQNILFCVMGITGLAATLAASQRMGGWSGDDYKFFDELVEVKHIISQRYVDVPDEKALRQGAIAGMVEALNDPYTVYVPASEQRDFNKDLTGEYVGIGASVNIQNGWLTIVSPLEDSPAFRSGLMAEDRVVAIGGVSTQNKAVDDCVELLMGEPGTPVVLTIERKGQKLDLTVIRDRIKTRSVKGVHRSAKDAGSWDYFIDPARKIAYVRLSQFTPKCADEVENALKSVGADKGELKGLVLDLRFNPGGLLNEAEAIADLFLENGVIVSTRGRAFAEKITRAKAPGTLPDFPVTVLVNGSSASASEVLAGALVENNRAIVVGTRSYGKGSVQSVLELPSGGGSELKITEQGYYLPSGKSITRKDASSQWGVDPSEGFYVPMTDVQVGEMLEVRRKEEVIRFLTEQNDAGIPVSAGEQAIPGTQSTPAAVVNGAVPATDLVPTPTPSTTPTSTPAADLPAATTLTAPVPQSVNWNDPDSILTYLKDPQLAAAVKALQIKIDTGSWQPTGETSSQDKKIASAELERLNQFQQRLIRELERTERRITAIETVAGDEAKPLADLWEDDLDLTGGMLIIKDKEGKTITTLDITGNNLERWLVDADIKKRPSEVK